MRYLFIFIAVLGITYFIFKKRKFDLFTLAFISGCIYFLPGFFGYLNSLYNNSKVNIVDETYIVMMLVLSSILFTAVIWDYFSTDKELNIGVKT